MTFRAASTGTASTMPPAAWWSSAANRHRHPALRGCSQCYLGFVISAIEADGSCHNRMDIDGQWTDDASTGDWWGRAVWAVGVAAVACDRPPSCEHAR